MTSEVHLELKKAFPWKQSRVPGSDNLLMAAWQSATVGLASEVWHTGGVRSGVGHSATTEVTCAIAMAIRARLNLNIAGYYHDGH